MFTVQVWASMLMPHEETSLLQFVTRHLITETRQMAQGHGELLLPQLVSGTLRGCRGWSPSGSGRGCGGLSEGVIVWGCLGPGSLHFLLK